MRANILMKLAAVLLITTAGSHQAAEAHSADSSKFTHHVRVNVRPSYLLPTHRFFRGENELGKRLDKSGSAHLQYSFSFPSGSHFGKLYPTAYQGFGVAFNTFFDHKEIGDPAAVYVFQGARLAQISQKLSLDYEWNFGVSFGWHPYDPYADLHSYVNEYNTPSLGSLDTKNHCKNYQYNTELASTFKIEKNQHKHFLLSHIKR